MSKCEDCEYVGNWRSGDCWRPTKECIYKPRSVRTEIVSPEIPVELEIEKNQDGYLTGTIKINGAELSFKADYVTVNRDTKNDCLENVKIRGKAGS